MIAPEIDRFTSANIPDLRSRYDQSDYWLTNHFLNSTLRAPYKGWVRQYAINFIFRAEMLFNNYHDARYCTLDYIEKSCTDSPNVTKYFQAVSAWESALLQWAGCFSTIYKASDEKLYIQGDGSVEERTWGLWTTIKHHLTGIKDGKLHDELTIPVWLSNQGMRSAEWTVSFSEFAESVMNMADLAEELVDPLSFDSKNRQAPANGEH